MGSGDGLFQGNKAHLDKIALDSLGFVIDDEFVVIEFAFLARGDLLSQVDRDGRADGRKDGFVGGIGRESTETLGAVLSHRTEIVLCEILGEWLLVDVSEGRLVDEHEDHIVREVRMAILGALRDNIGEIDALSKHVSRVGRFRRGDAETLREDTDKVRETTSVPEEFVVADAIKARESLDFSLALDPEEIDHLETKGGVDLMRMRLVDALAHEVCFVRFERYGLNVCSQFAIVEIDGIHLFEEDAGVVVHDGGRDLDLGEGRDEFELFLEKLLCVDQRKGFLSLEGMRDELKRRKTTTKTIRTKTQTMKEEMRKEQTV